MQAPLYCTLGLRWAGRSEFSLLTDRRGRILVFDGSPSEPCEHARSYIGALANGRLTYWSADYETCRFMDVEPNGVNEIVVMTGVDVYNTVGDWPRPSETRHRDWKHHVIWNQADWGQPEGKFYVPNLSDLSRMDKAA